MTVIFWSSARLSPHRSDFISIEDVNWWYNQVRKDVINMRTNIVHSLHDNTRNLVVKQIKAFQTQSNDVTISGLDRLDLVATAECNTTDLQKAVRSNENIHSSLNQSHTLANDMIGSSSSVWCQVGWLSHCYIKSQESYQFLFSSRYANWRWRICIKFGLLSNVAPHEPLWRNTLRFWRRLRNPYQF